MEENLEELKRYVKANNASKLKKCLEHLGPLEPSIYNDLLRLNGTQEINKIIDEWYCGNVKKKKIENEREKENVTGGASEQERVSTNVLGSRVKAPSASGELSSRGSTINTREINGRGPERISGIVKNETAPPPPSSNSQPKGDPNAVKAYYTEDKLRNKCLTLIFEAIKGGIKNVDYNKAAYVSKEIERELCASGKSSDAKFVRSKVLNLKDKDNPILREKVYSGEISARRFIEMSADEMKSKELRKEEQKMKEESILDSRVATREPETDVFFCTKCKQRKCTYKQLQTRSADEPMTIFVYCVCGNTWKFS
jgi:transcription elongation factor S-II